MKQIKMALDYTVLLKMLNCIRCLFLFTIFGLWVGYTSNETMGSITTLLCLILLKKKTNRKKRYVRCKTDMEEINSLEYKSATEQREYNTPRRLTGCLRVQN